MKRTKRIITLMLLVACCGMSMFAQAPAKIRYQAVARDAENAIIQEKPVAVQVSILQGSMTGTAVYVETSNVITNFDGLMSFTIGEGTPTTGTLANVDWAKGPYFVQVAIDAKGGTNYTTVATNQLLSVPYALFAEKSANAFDGEYSGLTNTPIIPVVPAQTSGYENDANYLTAEKQELSITGQALSISEGNTITLPTSTTIEFNDLTNHPAGINNGDMLFWNDNTKKWDIVEAGKPGQVLGFFSQGQPQWADMDETGKLSNNDCGTVTDIDGNKYNTVLMGKKCWMKENLKVTKYPNGNPLTQQTNYSSAVMANGKYAIVTNKFLGGDINGTVDGTEYYYNWCTANNTTAANTNRTKIVQGICPDGWHIPNIEDCQALCEFVDPTSAPDALFPTSGCSWSTRTNCGAPYKAGNDIRTKSIAIKLCAEDYDWNSYGSVNATGKVTASSVANTVGNPASHDPSVKWDIYGFHAIPTGYINKNATYGWYANGAFQIWTSYSVGATNTAFSFRVNYNNPGAYLSTWTDNDGACGNVVRCVNDKEF